DAEHLAVQQDHRELAADDLALEQQLAVDAERLRERGSDPRSAVESADPRPSRAAARLEHARPTEALELRARRIGVESHGPRDRKVKVVEPTPGLELVVGEGDRQLARTEDRQPGGAGGRVQAPAAAEVTVPNDEH